MFRVFGISLSNHLNSCNSWRQVVLCDIPVVFRLNLLQHTHTHTHRSFINHKSICLVITKKMFSYSFSVMVPVQEFEESLEPLLLILLLHSGKGWIV